MNMIRVDFQRSQFDCAVFVFRLSTVVADLPPHANLPNLLFAVFFGRIPGVYPHYSQMTKTW